MSETKNILNAAEKGAVVAVDAAVPEIPLARAGAHAGLAVLKAAGVVDAEKSAGSTSENVAAGDLRSKFEDKLSVRSKFTDRLTGVPHAAAGVVDAEKSAGSTSENVAAGDLRSKFEDKLSVRSKFTDRLKPSGP